MPDLAELLTKLGQEANTRSYREPTYKCSKCRDTGMIEIDAATRTFAPCPCQAVRAAERRIERSGLANAIKTQTLKTFQTKTQTQTQMLSLAKSYIKDLFAAGNRFRPWLYIGGNPGSGKTHLCTAIAGEILNKGIGVRYMQWVDEARRLKANVNDDDFENMVGEYITAPVLYIDDLLKQRWTQNPTFTEADIKIAFTVLNARYLRDKPTIISSEWDLVDQLMPADEGTFSRVYERTRGHRLTIPRDPRNNFRLMA